MYMNWGPILGLLDSIFGGCRKGPPTMINGFLIDRVTFGLVEIDL
jgi:hypothetical protein